MHFTGMFRSIAGLLLFLLLSIPLFGQPPAGYYSTAEGLEGEELRHALHEIIKGHNRQSYSSIWTHFSQTDLKPETNIVWDMYTDVPGADEEDQLVVFIYSENQCTGGTEAEGSCYNREHSFPTSWWGGGTSANDTMYTDLFHIHPTDSWVNSHRSNHPYGEVNGEPTTLNGGKRGPNAYEFSGELYTGTVFEPIDEYKGDLARNYFYMLTRYKHRIADWSDNTPMLEDGDFAPWALSMLLKWHEQDPVSQKEIDRNNAVYAIQDNRNPFIDNPNYATLIWGTDLYKEPDSHVTQLSANSITLHWTDAGGEKPPQGYLVRMSDQGFEEIETPEDRVPVTNDNQNKNIAFGRQSVTFGNLTPGTEYFFKIFSYRGAGISINYKTDEYGQTSIIAQ